MTESISIGDINGYHVIMDCERTNSGIVFH